MNTEEKRQRLEKEIAEARSPRQKIGLMNDLAMELHYSDPAAALSLSQEILKLAEEIDFTLGAARSHFVAGMSLFKQADYVNAFVAFHLALDLFRESRDRWGESNALNNIGLIHQRIGDYSNALRFFSDSLKVKEEANDQYGKANVLISMAGIYRETKDFEEAKKIVGEALQISRQIGAEALIGKGLTEYGLILFTDHSLKEASEIFSQALQSYEKQNHQTGITQCLVQLGKVKRESLQTEEALSLFRKSLPLAEQIGDKNSVMSIHWQEALLYLDAHNHENAMSHLLVAKEMADQLGEKPMLEKVHEALSRLHEEEKNFEAALFHFRKSKEIAAEITINEATAMLRNMEISKKMEVLEKEKKLLEVEQQLAMEHERKRISHDLHDDIGATLSGFSIYSDVVKHQLLTGDTEEAVKSVESIGEDSRALLERLSDIVWAINPNNDQFEKIILRLRNYAMRMCAGKNITLDFQSDESLNGVTLLPETKNNLYLILKEAVNNAAKYSDCTELKISIQKNATTITASVCDDGKGFDFSSVQEGNGLKNMRHRAADIKSYFDLQTFPGKGTRLLLEIPA